MTVMYAGTFTFVQSTPSTLWEIQHNLGGVVIADVYFFDTERNKYAKMIPKDVEIVDDNNIKIYFSEPYSGKVSISV